MRHHGSVRAKFQRGYAAVLWLLGLLLAVSACMGPVSLPVSASGRYVGRSPDRCPYVSAKQVAEIVGQNVTRVSATHDWYTEGGSGCFYDLAASADVYGRQGVLVEYFPGMGRAGFWNRADVVDGVSVSGLGIEAVWSPVALTVLIRGSDVAVVSLNGSLAQATKIYRLAAPHLLPAVAANWTGGPALGSDARICKIYNANINTLHQEVIMAALRKAGRSITPALARDIVTVLTAHNSNAFFWADARVGIGCDEAAQGSVPDQ